MNMNTIERKQHHTVELQNAERALRLLKDKEMQHRIDFAERAKANRKSPQRFNSSRYGIERARLMLLISQHGGILAAMQRRK